MDGKGVVRLGAGRGAGPLIWGREKAKAREKQKEVGGRRGNGATKAATKMEKAMAKAKAKVRARRREFAIIAKRLAT